MRLLEWGLLLRLREGGVWSDTFSTTINTFCVRIDSGNGLGQFIPPKGFFSSWGKVWAYRLTRGLFQTKFPENQILIPKGSQSCSWRSRSPISTHVWKSKCGKHTHLLRIRETLPTFINHLVIISGRSKEQADERKPLSKGVYSWNRKSSLHQHQQSVVVKNAYLSSSMCTPRLWKRGRFWA